MLKRRDFKDIGDKDCYYFICYWYVELGENIIKWSDSRSY